MIEFKQGFWVGFMFAIMLVGLAFSVGAHP